MFNTFRREIHKKDASAGKAVLQRSAIALFSESTMKSSVKSSSMESNHNEKECNGENKCSSDSNVNLGQTCNCCGQFLNNSGLVFYQGHPQDAVEEFLALKSKNFGFASGINGKLLEKPKINITGFNIFDQAGHLVPFNHGLIGTDVRIYMSGYLKPVSSDSLDIDEESVPVKDVGPIVEWFLGNLDGGNRRCITLSTVLGEYNLLKPSDQYTPHMVNIYEQICLYNVVIEYLKKNYYLQPSYEELLEVIQKAVIPELNNKPLDEQVLQKHSQFLYDQVVDLEENEEPLITIPCMRELVDLMNTDFGRSEPQTKTDYKKVDKKAWTKATTTPLVRKTFESFFTNQLDKTNTELQTRRKRCGICSACQSSDCGVCGACRGMAKFGGRGGRRACERRPCTRAPAAPAAPAAGGAAGGTDDESQGDEQIQHQIEDIVHVKLTETYRKIKWIGKPVQVDAINVYYDKVEIDDVEYGNGDFVMLESSQAHIPALVARVVYMWKDVVRTKLEFFHAEVFIRSADTVLGEVGDPREVFLGDRCCHGVPLSSILRKASVEKKVIPADWSERGGKEVDIETFEDDGETYFYSKFYERFTARFEDVPADPECPNPLRQHRFCPSCERKAGRNMIHIPRVFGKVLNKSSIVSGNRTEYNKIEWLNHEYKKGCGVFLRPGTFKLRNNYKPPVGKTKRPKTEKVDENMYPEYYRKSDNNCRGSNRDTGEPFCVAYIAAVTAVGDEPVLIIPQDMYLKVNVLYRAENTKNRFPQREDLNQVYWTDEICEIPFANVVGPCHLFYQGNIPQQESLLEWLEQDPSRFYFRKAYKKSTGKIVDVPKHATTIGLTESDKGKGKGKSSEPAETVEKERSEVNVRPLRSLDVFAGCGGLSDGLQRAGAAECRWAVEEWEAAAHAYSLNHERCSVFKQDCNQLLAEVMAGATHSGGMRLPMQGEVELLCGGPPCQGFSGMNRFNERDYSNFKNSLVASCLSYCDYYRPKYFLMENVRNFVAFKKGMVLKLTMRALLAMGYQCTFAVLQAGSYGLPQSRRRLFVVAAAPGLALPLFPEPTHVFNRRGHSLTTTIDGKCFSSNIRWRRSAPRRTCTVLDAISDLPHIANGANEQHIEYESEPLSHYQRLARGTDEMAKLRDHICKKMAPLVQARIERVPTEPGSDWRDLPNIAVTLPDGTKTKVLQYRYEDKRYGRSSRGGMRGVCACAGGQRCAAGERDRQEHTLIPWCLPHTANRHNHWAGLYGRLEWEGYFSTTVTDPEPMGKQGRVLHPSQARVLSVRECARSQGFRDHYVFAGSTLDKHRQIGNAVPPPLAAALGRAIKKAYASSLLPVMDKL